MTGTEVTNLERQQRALLAMIKQQPVNSGDDEWLSKVESSDGMRMARSIALWWLRYQVEAQCIYTVRILKTLGQFEDESARFFTTNHTSPYVEELAERFLSAVAAHEGSMAAAVAQFERAILRANGGSAETYEVLWDWNPLQVFQFIDGQGPMPAAAENERYRMTIGKSVANMITCEREVSEKQDKHYRGC